MQSLSESQDFYVYALLDPRKPGPFIYNRWKFRFQPFYIGKGKGRRASAHLHNRTHQPNKKKASVIASIRKDGLEPIVAIRRRNLAEDQALALETKIIAAVGHRGRGPLTNVTNGGQGLAGHRHSSATRRKMSASHRRRFATMDRSERKDLSNRASRNASKYHLLSEDRKAEIKRNMSEARKRYWASLTGKEREARVRKQLPSLKRASVARWG